MTPQREEAARMLRLACRDEAAFTVLRNAPQVGLPVALFHAQQAAEKALKAVMFLCGVEFRRTHDLEELATQLANAGVTPPVGKFELRRLTPYAVEFRYDDEAHHLIAAAQARVNRCRVVGLGRCPNSSTVALAACHLPALRGVAL